MHLTFQYLIVLCNLCEEENKVVWQSEWDSYELLLGNYSDGKVDGTLVAITLMIAESKPEEKDVMVKLIMNLLKL